MDDDSDDERSAMGSAGLAHVPTAPRAVAGQQQRQGAYVVPKSGLLWVWHRPSGTNLYDKLSIRNAGTNQDLCVASFSQPVKVSSGVKGRRTNTTLPYEDRVVLKGELTSGAVRLLIQTGTLLEDHCFPNNCLVGELETSIGLATPWDSESKHRLEISFSTAKRAAAKGTIAEPLQKHARRQQSGDMLAHSTSAGEFSEEQDNTLTQVSVTLGALQAALAHNPTLLEHIENLTQWLQDSCL